jgi:hypothetical protein
MYALTEQSVHRLLTSAKKIHGDLVASPMWELLKDEPAVVEFIAAIDEVDKQVNQNEASV